MNYAEQIQKRIAELFNALPRDFTPIHVLGPHLLGAKLALTVRDAEQCVEVEAALFEAFERLVKADRAAQHRAALCDAVEAYSEAKE